MKYFFSILALSTLIPGIVFAAVNDVFDAEALVIDLLGRLGYLFWILALALFFWGLVKFINNAADTSEHESGKQLMVWGIISFLILFSLWGIVRFILVDTLNINAAPINYVNRSNIVVN
jgi:hypothetical protein